MGNEEERAHLHRDAVPLELLVYYHTIKTLRMYNSRMRMTDDNYGYGLYICDMLHL